MLKALDFDNELINLIEKEMDSMRKKFKTASITTLAINWNMSKP